MSHSGMPGLPDVSSLGDSLQDSGENSLLYTGRLGGAARLSPGSGGGGGGLKREGLDGLLTISTKALSTRQNSNLG